MSRGWCRVGRVVRAVVAMALAVGVCVPSAVADDVVPLGWYLDDFGVRDAWAQGIDGSGVKVAVIDSAVVEDYPALQDADISYRLVMPDDSKTCTAESDFGEKVRLTPEHPTIKSGQVEGKMSSHGTHMASLIVGNGQGYDGGVGVQGVAPKTSLDAYIYSANEGFGTVCMTDGTDKPVSTNDALAAAVESGARIVNMSFNSIGGANVETFVEALRHGVIMVSGRANITEAGANDFVGDPSVNQYFPGVVTVNAVDRDGKLSQWSDTTDGNVAILSPGVNVAGHVHDTDREIAYPGVTGTSSAAALLSGYLALVVQRWPEATGNQVLQSLVRNTQGNASGEARLDAEHKRGFGVVDVQRLLEVDPSRYPDVNPLLELAVTRSEEHEETQGMYTDHSSWGSKYMYGKTDPFPYEIMVPYEASLVGQEYERQKAAWERVEQCRGEGGQDCMRYSATNTASQKDPEPVPASEARERSAAQEARWVVPVAVGVVVLLVIAGIVIVVRSKTRKV